jgi:hypothetical protein
VLASTSPSLDRLSSPKEFASANSWMRLGRFVDALRQIRGYAYADSWMRLGRFVDFGPT